MSESSALDLHRNAIVVDAVAPLLRDKSYLGWYVDGGVTAVAPTVAIYENAGAALRLVGNWLAHIRRHPDLMLVRKAADIRAAKQLGQLGIILHFQGSDPIENDLDLLDAFKALGVGVIQLTYNVKNRIGDGASERTDAGLSHFGVTFIERCNEIGIVVDCSHTGVRTTLEAIEVSSRPVIFSHANAFAVHPSRRNITDEQIRAIAKKGGVIGAVGFPGFVSRDLKPSLDRFVDHIDHFANVAGLDHVGLGIDYYPGQHPVANEVEARRNYEVSLATGKWSSDVYPAPPHIYPKGIETPRTLYRLTERLLARGYSAHSVEKILGGNWLRIYEEVWGG